MPGRAAHEPQANIVQLHDSGRVLRQPGRLLTRAVLYLVLSDTIARGTTRGDLSLPFLTPRPPGVSRLTLLV